MFKTKVRVKDVKSRYDSEHDKITLYMTFSVRGRRNYTRADHLCVQDIRSMFTSQLSHADEIPYFIHSMGWGDDKCKTLKYVVELILVNRHIDII